MRRYFKPPLPQHLSQLDDPLRALLVLAVVVQNNIPKDLQRALGMTGLDVKTVETTYADSIARLRELQCSAELLSAEQVGKWILARIGEMALGATSPAELAQAARALSKLPDWVRDPQTSAIERDARRLEAQARALKAQTTSSAALSARDSGRWVDLCVGF
jgi:hypothetical protein